MDSRSKDTRDTRKRNKSTITPQQLIELGKLPPQAVDIEEAVLGGLMLDKDAVMSIIDIMKPEAFYKEAHQRIFAAIESLFKKADPVDILTVTQELKRSGELEIAGGAFYVTQLTNRIASTANIQVHARIVLEKYIQRELIRISTDTLQKSYEDTSDVFELLRYAEENIFSISNTNIKKTFEHIKTILARSLDEIETAKNQEFNGVPSGFTSLDRITGGWQKSDLIILAARPGNGKCLGKGTKVVMFDGSLKNVENVKKDDLLMGVDSKPRKVISITSGIDKMYWIKQNKGIDYRVNESHILSLKRSKNNYWYRNGKRHSSPGNHGDILNISVKDYLAKLKPELKSQRFKFAYKGYKTGINFIEKELPIEPYFLGVWLGDGSSSSSNVCSMDDEIVQYLKCYAKKIGLKFSKFNVADKSKCPMYNISSGIRGGDGGFSLQALMRKLKLLDDKHIPQDYLINSEKNRLELLAGLIDTDGYRTVNGGYEITQKNEVLIKQIKFLCDSLGFRTSLASKMCSIKRINFEGIYFRLIISGHIEKIPIKIKRKKSGPLKHKVDCTMTGIEVSYDKIDEYYGFELEGDGLFLLEDCTVTHNSSFAVTTARNAAILYNKPVAIFSLEMASTQLVNRLISSEAEINADRLRQGDVNTIQWQQIHKNIGRLAASPIYIDDTPGLSIFDFRAKAKRLKQQHDVAMIIVDYLQLMTSGSDNKFGNREQEVSLISRTLKAIAKELDIPIIALSQMGRSVEQRQGKRPQLSDLRESGAIEQDADIVIFIYRPFISGVTEDPDTGMSTEGMAEIIIEKHRNGKIGSVNLAFIEAFAKFAELGSEGNSSAEFKSAASSSPDSTAHVEREEFADSMPSEKIMPNTDFLNQGPNHSIDNIDPEAGF